MVDFAHALSALGLDVVTFNFLYTEQGRRIPDRAPALEALLSRGHRRRARAGRVRAAARCSSAASRWADGSRRRSPPPIPQLRARRSRAARVSAASARQAGPAPRQASAGDRAADAVRPGHPRRVRHAGGARADSRARCSRAPRRARRRATAIIRSSCRGRIRRLRRRSTPTCSGRSSRIASPAP